MLQSPAILLQSTLSATGDSVATSDTLSSAAILFVGFAAAAVAAAAEDSLDGWADVCTSTTAAGSVVQHNGPDMSNEKAVRLQDAFDQHVQMRDSPYNLRLSSSVAAASFVATKVKAAVAGGRHTGATAAAAAASKQGGLDNSAPVTNAAVGPDPVCKDTTSSPEPHCKDTSNADPVCKDTSSQSVSKDTRYLPGGLCKATAMQPIPSVQEARQALARAFQLLEAAKAEPQWLRGAGRQFDAIAWAKVIAQTQQLALRCAYAATEAKGFQCSRTLQTGNRPLYKAMQQYHVCLSFQWCWC